MTPLALIQFGCEVMPILVGDCARSCLVSYIRGKGALGI